MANNVVRFILAVVKDNKLGFNPVGSKNILDFDYDSLTEATEYARKNNVFYHLIVDGSINLSGYKHNKNDVRPVPEFNKFIIYGDFDCSNQGEITKFPIIVKGLLNCSGLLTKGIDITDKSFFLPIKMDSLDCSYSIKSLNDLLGRIPTDLRHLMVQPQLIKSNILSKDNEKYEIAKSFCEEYPDLIITDSRNTINLANELKKIEEKSKESVNVEKQQEIGKFVKVIKIKTSDYLDRDEIVKKLVQDFDEFSDFSYDELKNITRRALNRNRNVVKQEPLDKNGTEVMCVSVKDFDLILPVIRDYIAEQKCREEKEKEYGVFFGNESDKEKNNEEPQQTSEQDVKDEEIYVEKYISKHVYNRISSLDNTPEILERLDGVNIDFSTINRQTGIIFINGKKYDGFRLKRPDCIVSSFKDNMDDPKRLVIRQVYDINNQPIYICTDYFGTHTGSKKITDEYKATWTKDLGKNVLEAIKNKDNYITLMELRQNGYRWEK